MPFRSVSPTEASELILQGAAVFDVRTQPEYRQHRIRGAHLLPIQELHQRHPEIPRESTVPLLIVCEHGIRSVAACEALHGNGWANIVNVEGGMAAWIDAGLPVEGG